MFLRNLHLLILVLWILDEVDGKLDSRQCGALKGRSTTHELIDILYHWHQAL